MIGIIRGYMNEKNFFIIFAAILFAIVFSGSIYSSIESYKYRRLCNQYREQLIATTEANRELGRTIEECQSITGSIGELCNRNISSSRGIIEITEELRAKVYELESRLGVFDQHQYYQYYDSYFRDEGLMD